MVYRKFDFDTGTVYLFMKGSCAGCPSSDVTLKQGIEKMLCHYVGEVKVCKQKIMYLAPHEYNIIL
ncbi:MAG: NifU family protein [Ignavibacteria bacterium]|nr:NifU family protein [Ignavibacteria bacterium]